MPKRYFLGWFCSVLLIFSACGPKDRPVSYSDDQQALSSNWLPLTTLVERAALPFVSDGVVTTISPKLYVKDIALFNQRFPVGSLDREVIRVHEQNHALHQEEFIDGSTGITRSARMTSWISKYVGNSEFRWEVESQAFEAEIFFKLDNGLRVIPEEYAFLLSSPTYRGMITYEDALEWVKQTISKKVIGVQ